MLVGSVCSPSLFDEVTRGLRSPKSLSRLPPCPKGSREWAGVDLHIMGSDASVSTLVGSFAVGAPSMRRLVDPRDVRSRLRLRNSARRGPTPRESAGRCSRGAAVAHKRQQLHLVRCRRLNKFGRCDWAEGGRPRCRRRHGPRFGTCCCVGSVGTKERTAR